MNKIILNHFDKIIQRTTLALDVREELKDYHVRSVNSHLILSSSVGSYIAISGNLNILGIASGTFSGSLSGSVDIFGGKLSNINASGTFSGSLSGSVDIFGGKLSNINASGTFSGSLSGALDTINNTINNSLGRLILSSSANLAGGNTSVVVVSGTLIVGSLSSSYIPRGVGPANLSCSMMVNRTNGYWGLIIQGSGTVVADMLLEVSGGVQNEKTVQHAVNNASQYLVRSLTDAGGVGKNLFFADLSTGMTAIGASAATTSAKLAIGGTDGGFLPPRLTNAQKDALTGQTNGTMIFNTTSGSLQVYINTWQIVTTT